MDPFSINAHLWGRGLRKSVVAPPLNSRRMFLDDHFSLQVVCFWKPLQDESILVNIRGQDLVALKYATTDHVTRTTLDV